MTQNQAPASSLPDLQTSGDLIADRRYGYACALLQERDGDAATDLFAQLLERVPDWPPALLGMGDACLLTQDTAQAAHYFRLCLARDPSDRLGAGPRLARMNALAADNAIGPAYVAALFDDYAKRFDNHLVDALDYRAPDLLLEALLHYAPSFPHAYDLGCGTGLMGALLRPLVLTLGGCDLSPAMLEEARRKNIYDQLDLADCVQALHNLNPASFDLVTAADVVVYIGSLTELFAKAHESLKTDGLFALTAQACTGDHFMIGEDLRSAHSEAYLREQAHLAGFETRCLDAVSVRKDRGQPVSGWLCLFRKIVRD
jgi:predicted TPR repeat methyltransferase